MRLNALEGGFTGEIEAAQQAGINKITRDLGAPSALHQLPVQQALDSRLQGLDRRQFQLTASSRAVSASCCTSRPKAMRLRWVNWVGLIRLGDEVDDLGFEDAAAHSDLDAMMQLYQLRRRAVLRVQHLKVAATALLAEIHHT